MNVQNRHLLPGNTPSKPGNNVIPSSSPAFATPAVNTIRPPTTVPTVDNGSNDDSAAPQQQQQPRKGFGPLTTANGSSTTILPVLIPPATLRPLAFRIFTKRHNLTLQGSALASLATFVGRNCGSGWRDEGLAEKVLEEAAKRWKRSGGASIVVEGQELTTLLKDLTGNMSGGRVIAPGSRVDPDINEYAMDRAQMTMRIHASNEATSSDKNMGNTNGATQDDLMVGSSMTGAGITITRSIDPRRHLKIISAFDQPRLTYNATKRHFEKITKPPSLFPEASTRTAFFKQRYHMVHQRLMRNESFQAPTSVVARRVPSLQRSASSFVSQQSYKLSSVTDLLGRHGTSHILLGLLTIAPAGHYAISDLSGSITLDFSLAIPTPDWAWVVPGMMVIVDGTYEEDGVGMDTTMVGSNTGIGGTIGGRFIVSTIAGPPSEKREKTLGIAAKENDAENGKDDFTPSSGFGWVDFLGVGSEKTTGEQMRQVERQFQKSEEPGGRGRVVILGDLNLDIPETFEALRKILTSYEIGEPGSTPMSFVLTGNFVSTAGMARTGTAGSIEYKESFDLLASTLSDYPRLISSATFVFVPGDNDPWASAFSASASTTVPRQSIPTALTSRIRRAFQTANLDRERTPTSNVEGEAIFTSNPTRISLFGPAQEMVILRDDMTGRIRRSVVAFEANGAENESDDEIAGDGMQVDGEVAQEESEKTSDDKGKTARQLVKMLVDQSYLSPFSVLTRPVLWDYAPALHMVPLPTALVITDTDAPPFALGYGGCFVMNPGRCLVENRKGQARWIEYDAVTKRGKTMQISF